MNIDDENEVLKEISSSISEIHFKEVPELHHLESFLEQSKEIKIYLPKKTPIPIFEIYNYFFCKNIVEINLSTDAFTDSSNLYVFHNLKNLALSFERRDTDHIDQEDAYNMLIAITNLTKLETLEIDIYGLKKDIIETIEQIMPPPSQGLKLSYIENRSREMRKPKIY